MGNGVDGVDEIDEVDGKCKDNIPTAENSSSPKINGTPKDDEQDGVEKLISESSEAECGPSSSNGLNGTEQIVTRTLCLIGDDSEDDTDDDDDDIVYEASAVNK